MDRGQGNGKGTSEMYPSFVVGGRQVDRFAVGLFNVAWILFSVSGPQSGSPSSPGHTCQFRNPCLVCPCSLH